MSGVGGEGVFHTFAVLIGPDLGQPRQIEYRVRLVIRHGSGILIIIPSRDHDLGQDDRIDHADHRIDITGDIGVSGQPFMGDRLAHHRQSEQRQEDGRHDKHDEGAESVHARERSAAPLGGQHKS